MSNIIQAIIPSIVTLAGLGAAAAQWNSLYTGARRRAKLKADLDLLKQCKETMGEDSDAFRHFQKYVEAKIKKGYRLPSDQASPRVSWIEVVGDASALK